MITLNFTTYLRELEDSNSYDFFIESHTVHYAVPEVGRAFNATKDARASISENKYALYTISGLGLEQATILPLAIFESIINIPGNNNRAVIFYNSHSKITSHRCIGCCHRILKRWAVHRGLDLGKITCACLFVS